MPKLLQFHDAALKSIHQGLKKLAKAVKVTLGPKGRNVIIQKKFGLPLSTKDGVTVAKEICLKDKFENVGAELVKEVASKTAEIAGDGTTTAIVLAEAIFNEGYKNVSSGSNPLLLKKGMDKATKKILETLKEMAKPVQSNEEIKQIATISGNNDPEIGSIIAEAMETVGKEGIISVSSTGKSTETKLVVTKGLQFDKGYLSPYFVTNPQNMSVELSNPLVFITDFKLSTVKEIVPILEKAMEHGTRPFLIIAEDVEGEALSTLVVNKLKASLPVCAVKAPGYGDHKKDILKDLSILTGATLLSKEAGYTLEDFSEAFFGSSDSIQITKEATVVIGGCGTKEQIQERALFLKNELQKDSLSKYEKERLESRLAHLVSGVAIIEVGALSEVDLEEKKARIEDALHATKAAVKEGIVAGGGVALIQASKALNSLLENTSLSNDEKTGIQIIQKACFIPCASIASNGGKNGEMIAQKVYENTGSFGYNGLTDTFSNLIEDGVVDPVLVTKSALFYASSVAGMLLTTAAVITEKPQPKIAPSNPSMDEMGGMGGMGDFGGMGGMDMM